MIKTNTYILSTLHSLVAGLKVAILMIIILTQVCCLHGARLLNRDKSPLMPNYYDTSPLMPDYYDTCHFMPMFVKEMFHLSS